MSKLPDKLAALRDSKFREPELQSQMSVSSHYFTYCEGFNAGAAEVMAMAEKLASTLAILSTHEPSWDDDFCRAKATLADWQAWKDEK